MIHFCQDEVKIIAWVVGGITLIPLYCRWCWYKVRATMGRKQPLLQPPTETAHSDQLQA